MSITLRPEHEKAVRQAVQSGTYENPDQVIARALELLRIEDQWIEEHSAEIAERIERAFAQFEHGEFYSPEESRAEMEKRKTAWRNEHTR